MKISIEYIILSILFFLVIFSQNNVYGHTDENHTDESSGISLTSFVFANFIILLLSLSLTQLIDRYQQNEKFISVKTMITIIIVTLIINAIIAINTYVEIK